MKINIKLTKIVDRKMGKSHPECKKKNPKEKISFLIRGDG